MPSLNPNEFDAFNRGEPTPVLLGKTDNRELDYYRRGEVLGAVVPFIYAPSGTASISGGGTLAATGKKAARVTLTLSGGGTQTTTAKKNARAVATLSGGGAQSASDRKNAKATAAITGGGAVSGTGAEGAAAAVAISGGGSLSATGTAFQQPTVVETPQTGGNALLRPSTRRPRPRTRRPIEKTGTVYVTGAGNLDAHGTKTLAGQLVISAAGALAVSGRKQTQTETTRFSAAGTFTAAGSKSTIHRAIIRTGGNQYAAGINRVAETPTLDDEFRQLLEDAVVLTA